MTRIGGDMVHPTAIVEEGVVIGEGTSIWDNVHIREGATIGSNCIIGEKTYVAGGVRIADRVKINAFVYLCYGVELETGVMVCAGSVFTNDPYPRATSPDLSILRPSGPDGFTQMTRVREGATIGARAVIGGDLEIGRFAMVGMGTVVTRSVGDFQLVVGNPARPLGWVCRCGRPVLRYSSQQPATEIIARCSECGKAYAVLNGSLTEVHSPPTAR